MRLSDFTFDLPEVLIAQRPAAARDQSRLLVFNRVGGQVSHRPTFRDVVDHLQAGDVLVLNDTRVLPARLRGKKSRSGGEIELLLLEEVTRNEWWTLLRPGKRVRPGTHLEFAGPLAGSRFEGVVLEKNEVGHCRLQFTGIDNLHDLLEEIGEIPLPPYIGRRAEEEDRERYQTVFARDAGSVAAPTAGLHFTTELLNQIRANGVEVHSLTLHVGLGTFAPVKVEAIEQHLMHEEAYALSASTAEAVNRARKSGRRVVAVGTTTVRVLESVALANEGDLVAAQGRTRIFIYPPFRFRVVDALLTNFHLPQSTLLMLVSAFAAPGEIRGRDLLLATYREAVREGYRFFSYGDAMLIL
jgi:S-adenosylmethionine:tRNA ribosyltransferase-isomerase